MADLDRLLQLAEKTMHDHATLFMGSRDVNLLVQAVTVAQLVHVAKAAQVITTWLENIPMWLDDDNEFLAAARRLREALAVFEQEETG